nr:MAG TPA: hypothetical protein [Caudoviricetes sp.]
MRGILHLAEFSMELLPSLSERGGSLLSTRA